MTDYEYIKEREIVIKNALYEIKNLYQDTFLVFPNPYLADKIEETMEDIRTETYLPDMD